MYHEQELLYLYHLGSQEAYELLLKKYRFIIEKYVVFNYMDTVEMAREDYVQVALTSFFKTLDSYRLDMNTKMSTYFSYAIIDAIRSSMRFINTKKHIPYHKLVSLNEDKRDYIFNENILDDHMSIYKPDVHLKIKEDIEYYQSMIDENGSSLEKKVFYYLIYGYSFDEVAQLLNIDIKKVYNAKYRLQKKMTKFK